MGRSSATATFKERTIHGSLENISHPPLTLEYVELLMVEEQFKLKYGGSIGIPASVSALSVTEMYQAVTPTEEMKEIYSIRTTIASG